MRSKPIVHERGTRVDVHEVALVFAQFIPKFNSDARGRYRGPANYRGGDNPTALSIDVRRGLWFDHVTGDGGDCISFVMMAVDTDFRGACRAIESIIGRDVLDCHKPLKPRFTESDLLRANRFAIGFRWHIERYLDVLKELWFLDETAVNTGSICDATRLLEAAGSWTVYQAAEFMHALRRTRPRWVTECIREAHEAETQLACAIAGAFAAKGSAAA